MARQDIMIGAVAGVAIAVIAPLAILMAIGDRRPVIRALGRGGRMLSDKAQETFAECQEIIEDLVAEMRAPGVAAAAPLKPEPENPAGPAPG